MDDIKTEVNKCVEVLKAGGIILYPTDTIWGIGCDATNADAVNKIIQLKERPDKKSMIILIDQSGRLASYIKEVPSQAYDLMELSEEPLTLVLDGARNLPPNLVAEDGSIGVRLVLDDFCKRVIQRLGKPLVSTSANLSGDPSPDGYASINDRIKSGVDYIAEIRRNERSDRKASTIIKLGPRGEIKFLRK